jgi:gluconate 2-dehydrogenase gamma chain
MADEEQMVPGRPPVLSRRELLKRAGLAVGAAVGVPVVPIVARPQAPETLRALTAREFAALDAICARIIPSDDNGPGAREARASRYIDWALAGALGTLRERYAEGLAAVDARSMASRGAPFAQLAAADQDAVLDELSQDAVPRAPQGFFNTLRLHTIQGTFSDPYYGGNAGYAGWDLIGYPGARVAVPPQYQQWDTELTPNHQSVYDSDMFSKGVI